MNAHRIRIEQQRVGSVEVLTPMGALVDQDAEHFAATLSGLLKTANPRVVLSMQEVPYMDSIALEGLSTAADELADRAAGLKLACVTATCREILELTALAPRLRFFENLQDAIKSFL